MESLVEWREWAGFLLSFVLLPLLVMFRNAKERIFTKLDSIDQRVQETNGRVGKLETWVDEHEKEDQRNYERATRFEDEIRVGINELRSRK